MEEKGKQKGLDPIVEQPASSDDIDEQVEDHSTPRPTVPPNQSKRKPVAGLGLRESALFKASTRFAIPNSPLSARLSRLSAGLDSPLGRFPPRSTPRSPRSTPTHTAAFGGYSGLEEMRTALKQQAQIIDNAVAAEKKMNDKVDEAKRERIEAEITAGKLKRQVENLTRRLEEKDKAIQAALNKVPQTATQRENALQQEIATCRAEKSELEGKLTRSFDSAARTEKFLAESHRQIETLTAERDLDRENWASILSRNKETGGRGTKTPEKKSPAGTKGSPKTTSPEMTANLGDVTQMTESSSATYATTDEDNEHTGDTNLTESDGENEPDHDDDDDSNKQSTMEILVSDWDAMMEEYAKLQNMKEVFEFGAAAQDSLRAAAEAAEENALFEMSDIEAVMGQTDISEYQAQATQTQGPAQEQPPKDDVLGGWRKALESLDKAFRDKRQKQADLRTALSSETSKIDADELRTLLAASVDDLRAILMQLPDIPGKEMLQEHDNSQAEILGLQEQLRQAQLDSAARVTKQEAQFALKMEKLQNALSLAEDNGKKEKAELQGRLEKAKLAIAGARVAHKELSQDEQWQAARLEQKGSSVESLTTEIDEEIVDLIAKYDEQARKLREEQADLKTALRNSEAAKQSLAEEVAQLRKKIAKLEGTVEANQDKLRETVGHKSTPADGEEIKKLEATISELKEEIAEGKTRLTGKEENLTSLTKTIAAQGKHIGKLKEEVARLETEITHMVKRLQAAKAGADRRRRLKISNVDVALLQKTALESLEETKKLITKVKGLNDQISSAETKELVEEVTREDKDTTEAQQSTTEPTESEPQQREDAWAEEKKELESKLAEPDKSHALLQAKLNEAKRLLSDPKATTTELRQRDARHEDEARTDRWEWMHDFLSAFGPILGGNGLAWVRVAQFLWTLLSLLMLNVRQAYENLVSQWSQRAWAWVNGTRWTKPAQQRQRDPWPEVKPGDVMTVLWHVLFLYTVFKTGQAWYVLTRQLNIWLGANGLTRAYYHDVTSHCNSPTGLCQVRMLDMRFWDLLLHELDVMFMGTVDSLLDMLGKLDRFLGGGGMGRHSDAVR
ncbi:hypothetical protein ACHAQA_002174 [Verticillium albo-atrum]